MTSITIRYQYAKLLIWAAIALVTNPVWHALGDSISDHHSHEHHPHDEHHETIIQWTTNELCPYCDAVAQFALGSQNEADKGVMVLLWKIESPGVTYTASSYILSSRPRAPPFLV